MDIPANNPQDSQAKALKEQEAELLEQVNRLRQQTLAGQLGIQFIELSAKHAVATMPVDARTLQPAGILHGGASLALAETVASVAASLNAGPERIAVGMEINANHLRMVRSGLVKAIAVALHLGSKTSVWEIKIFDDEQRLICIARMTAMYVDRPQKSTTGSL